MAEPHNYRKVGYSMILVSASLTAIALIGLAIGEDVLFADTIQRANTAHFDECKETGFAAEDCKEYDVFITFDRCIREQDLESRACHQFQTYVESAIFEECRDNRDIESSQCQKYAGKFEVGSDDV
jgi:hypothetical protein